MRVHGRDCVNGVCPSALSVLGALRMCQWVSCGGKRCSACILRLFTRGTGKGVSDCVSLDFTCMGLDEQTRCLLVCTGQLGPVHRGLTDSRVCSV